MGWRWLGSGEAQDNLQPRLCLLEGLINSLICLKFRALLSSSPVIVFASLCSLKLERCGGEM